jgi:DNA-binding NarL/FixJ family response regulator
VPYGLDPTGGRLEPEQAQLLGLMLAGITDDVFARQLGVGRRTVARRIRSLLDQAGVSSRIQLGWRAADLGRLDMTGPQPVSVPGAG